MLIEFSPSISKAKKEYTKIYKIWGKPTVSLDFFICLNLWEKTTFCIKQSFQKMSPIMFSLKDKYIYLLKYQMQKKKKKKVLVLNKC